LGADIINDASFFSDDKMLDIVIKAGKKLVLMHSRGTPETMNSLAQYENVTDEIFREIHNKQNSRLMPGLKKRI
jgi:dihydropteroate synthase